MTVVASSGRSSVAEADTVGPDDATPPDPTTPQSPRPWRWILLVGVAVAVGFALRVAVGLTDDAPSTDETAYLRSGVSLVDGDGFARGGRPELHFPPLVPFLLGMTSRAVGDPHTAAVVLTALASSALPVLLALLGRRVAGPTAGLVTAWVAALAPGLSTAFVNRGAGSEAAYTLLVVTALWLVVAAGERRGRAQLALLAAAGGSVGLAYLTRPEGLFVAAPLVAAVVVPVVRDTVRGRRLRSVAPRLAGFAVPIAVCVVPYAMYLHQNTGGWQLSAKTQDASIEAWHAVARNDREARDSVLWALDGTGLDLAARSRSSLPSLAREDPTGYATIVATNVGRFVAEIVNPEPSTLLAWLLLPLPVWLLAGLGGWRHRRSRAVGLLMAVGAVPVATALVFFVQPRYLFVLVALATVLVGAAVVTLPEPRRRPVLAGVLALLVVSSAQGFRGDAGWWHPAEQTDQRRAGEWIAENTAPGDRIMTRSMTVELYAQRPAMALPYAELDAIIRYAAHYGTAYLVVDGYSVERLRPQLLPLRDADSYPGLRLVHEVTAEGRTTRIFAFDPAPAPGAPMGAPLGFVGDGSSA